MDPNMTSPEMAAFNKASKRSLKPMLKYIPSQRLLNWISHRAPPETGAPFEQAISTEITLAGPSGTMPALQAVPHHPKPANASILYFHGGAYTLQSARSSAPHVRRLAGSTGLTTIAPDYRLATVAPYPAAVDDAELAYETILQTSPPDHRIILHGDSAGGGLALALLLRLMRKARPLPACCVTLSPWADLRLNHDSYTRCAQTDVILSHAWLNRAARLYAGQTPRTHPGISPLLGDFKGAPPQLVLYSSAELFCDEDAALIEKMRAAEVSVEQLVHHTAPHAWPVAAANTPEASAAYDIISAFIGKHSS